MKFALGECGSSGDKKAWYYTACLQRYFNKRVKPEDLLTRIAQNGGMRAIYEAELEARRKVREEKEQDALKAAHRAEGGDDQVTPSGEDEDDLWGPKKEQK